MNAAWGADIARRQIEHASSSDKRTPIQTVLEALKESTRPTVTFQGEVDLCAKALRARAAHELPDALATAYYKAVVTERPGVLNVDERVISSLDPPEGIDLDTLYKRVTWITGGPRNISCVLLGEYAKRA